MGLPARQKPVKLIASIIYNDRKCLDEAERAMVREFGEMDPGEKSYSFDFTDYYEEEMGGSLYRKIISFKRHVDPEDAYRIKLFSNSIEKDFGVNGRRTVNIDPGYVTEAKLVLLTTKDYSHRVHLRDGIFAEVTLHFQGRSFRPWPWTYPDYSSEKLIRYFNSVRQLYMEERK